MKGIYAALENKSAAAGSFIKHYPDHPHGFLAARANVRHVSSRFVSSLLVPRSACVTGTQRAKAVTNTQLKDPKGAEAFTDGYSTISAFFKQTL